MTRAEDGRVLDAATELESLIRNPRTPDAISLFARISLPAALLRGGVFDRVPLLEHLLAEARSTDRRLAVTVATGSFAVGQVAQGHVKEAVHKAEQYMEMEGPFRSMIPVPYTVPAIAYAAADRFDAARVACQEGRRRASEVGEVLADAYYGPLEALICLLAGDWEDAVEEAAVGLDLVSQGIGSPVCFVMARATLGQVSLRRGNIDAAKLHVSEGERMLLERGPQWGSDLLSWTKALCIETSGDLVGALDALLIGWKSAESGHHLFGRPIFPDLVRLAVATGERDLATRVTEEAEEARRRAEEIPSIVGAALRCRGILEDNIDLLVAAVDAYRKSPRVLEKAAACEEAAGSLVRRGTVLDARPLYEEALTIFEELGATHDSARILAVMRSAGIRRGSHATRRRAATGWEALTPTEIDVARLTVEGLTNPKIAERLYVSKYTVQTHLSHIFTKLQISSRAELAVMAAKHQP